MTLLLGIAIFNSIMAIVSYKQKKYGWTIFFCILVAFNIYSHWSEVL